ncbi:Cytochrome P450 E-class group I [Penicillium brevicompactum]|uniref:Cytochrome P450 E-class group I n=1 Tax=Penicillium brevicompactum TaxID=5074 RepID=UPI00254072B1|nr:Cytochrome P450 E-class group I [Penicillium brevicompactum]KAJ5348201.1 Cytochrome P450 E-class group I [Penicillium brevicompactum]
MNAKYSLSTYAVYMLLGAIILRLLTNRYKRVLRDIPGPVLARYSRLWKLYSVWKGDHHHVEIDLHRKHGSLVRIGPNHISVSDPSAIPLIYGLNKGFTKTAFFPIQSVTWNKKPQMNIFSTRDVAYHRAQRRNIANSYSLSSLLESEPAVDSCTALFTTQLSKFADQKTPVDLGSWLQYYAFDVIGEVTFSKKLGFLEQGCDVDNMMEAIRGILIYSSLCGQVPELHHVLLGNPLIPVLLPGMETWNQVLQFTLKAISLKDPLKQHGDIGVDNLTGKDMMSRWMAIHQADPERFSTRDAIVHLSANVFAGSDTTAIALRVIFYFLMREPAEMTKVVTEIDTAISENKVGNPISYHESTTYLPYLGAVIKEALRLHPSVGLILEREVPESGAEICGKHIPGGTTVGINAWVVNRTEEIFPNPDEFLPNRWLESSPEKLRAMEQTTLTFGAGSRSCLGKHISFMEMYKMIPQLLREFEIRLHGPEDWKTQNIWFVQQDGLICDLVKR